MTNRPQKASIAPQFSSTQQCPGCPIGNSLPLVAREDTCGIHSPWNTDNGADINDEY